MDNYFRRIPGSISLPEAINLIASEESGASQFHSSQVAFMNGKMANLVEFLELEPGTIPSKLSLKRAGENAPEGQSIEWTGVMLIAETLTPVSLYR